MTGEMTEDELNRLCECQHEPHPGEECPEQVRMGGVLCPCGCDDREEALRGVL